MQWLQVDEITVRYSITWNTTRIIPYLIQSFVTFLTHLINPAASYGALVCTLIIGVKENSIDSLVFDTLIPKPIIQRYLNLLMEHRRIIFSGPSGTGKSFLAAKLAEYIISQIGQEVTEHSVARFNVDQNSSKVRQQRGFRYCSINN